MSNKSEPARVRELATQLIKLHGETANTYGDDALWYSAAALRRCANRCENTHPAPALTAELKAEFLEVLKIGEKLLDRTEPYISYNDGYGSPAYMEFKDNKRKFHAAITKLTNLG
jgi:hypothetical protein